MEPVEANKAVEQLIVGFETLQQEYQALHGQHQALERKLATAREQYNELAKLCGSSSTATPPLSLASSSGRRQAEAAPAQTTLQALRNSDSQDAAIKVETAVRAVHSIRHTLPTRRPDLGVRIWSGPSADRQEIGSSALHSISESPLEQDFTVEGKPSRLGCPFASMANKKLSSHAASVLSRYKTGSAGALGSQTGSDIVNRVSGRESLSQHCSRRASFIDPIKAEICGLSDHRDELSPSEQVAQPSVENAESGVCPIRFLDQHSPEEVATYFEKHKHELPRSHEVCVRRYQSNEQQIRVLDEKYGNLVSMIQGLGAKHKDMLPPEPEDEDVARVEDDDLEEKEAEKVRKWASSVSAQVGEADAPNPRNEEDDDRVQHFERPLRDIRVGESPSRPWGISVPLKYLENEVVDGSSRPTRVPATHPADKAVPEPPSRQKAPLAAAGKATCPFGFSQAKMEPREKPEHPRLLNFASAEPGRAEGLGSQEAGLRPQSQKPQMVFSGPVFFGYSAEEAAKILRESGLGESK